MDIKKEYERWLANATADADVAAELKTLDDAKVEDAFYRDLAFGTGGLRGVIGAGTNRMNIYTVAKALMDAEPDADALITKILHRAELEYKFCSARDADPATLLIQKACTEYKPTEGFPETFYKEVVSKVILYRDTHIEFKLQNGQIV